MTDQEVIEAVRQVFVESFELPLERLTPEAAIFQDLGLDSLDLVDLVVALQKRFGVLVRNDERIRNVRTLQDLYDYLLTIRREQGL